MADALTCFSFETALGWVGLLSGPKGLLALTLPRSTEAGAMSELGGAAGTVEYSPDVPAGLVERLNGYFSGARTEFPDICDFSPATLFQAAVWEAARLIPYGETRSYGWLAERIGRPGASRAVGQALGRNPLPVIVPCHRVLAWDGSLGGFSSGLDMKKKLLALEGSAD